jgi:aldose sugar dehydrogenase
MQGAAMNPATGELWTHEHGPQGGDELNIDRAARNYGWPVITYGKEYVTGGSIGQGTEKAGMEQPIWKWVPSIAPSGMAFLTSDVYPGWKGNLFIGSLAHMHLVRLTLAGDKVVSEQRLLEDLAERIRDVRQGPDGYLYLLTDSSEGRVLKLVPKP